MIIGLDVGGTHTDVVLLGTEGLVTSAKVPTDAEDLFHTVLRGLEEVTAGVAPGEIHRVVLSTTLTTNAIVEDRVPPVGMIVAGGPGIDPEAYRTNPHYHPVEGAVDHRGRIVANVDARQIKSRGRSTGMTQDQGATLRTPSGLTVEMKVTGRGNKPSRINGFRIMCTPLG